MSKNSKITYSSFAKWFTVLGFHTNLGLRPSVCTLKSSDSKPYFTKLEYIIIVSKGNEKNQFRTLFANKQLKIQHIRYSTNLHYITAYRYSYSYPFLGLTCISTITRIFLWFFISFLKATVYLNLILNCKFTHLCINMF